MAILEILTYPDDQLRALCEPVTDFDNPEFQQFIDDLLETMHDAPGCVGIAAPQVGRPIQVVAIDCSLARHPPEGHHGLMLACNPEILSWSGMEVGREGCLSLPDYTGNVVRAVEAQLQFQDRTGQTQSHMLTGFEARVAQHEVDHLEGRMFIDRVVSRRADMFPRKQYQSRRSKKSSN
ncbi:MAG: peptide deformylase [Magnetococcales bacterium]|nr:peptide deformylase [Magnetococcales bacterium]